MFSHVLGPHQPQSKAFDADYAGGSSIFPAANKTDLMMIYHAEGHYGRRYGAAEHLKSCDKPQAAPG